MKVLIISHNPITRQSNMGITLQSLFADFHKEEICQIYVYPTVPNEKSCSSFYRITDKDVLESVFTRKSPGGEIPTEQISPDREIFENANDESLYRNKKNKSALRRLGRDLIWNLSGWYSQNLRSWLMKEKPEVLFVAPGVAKFIYDMALRISGELQIPIVTYICDEYYFVREPHDILDKLRLKLLKSKMDALMERTAKLITISQELKEIYTDHFGVDSTVVMTGAGNEVSKTPKVTEHPDTVSYFGNIRCNRFVSLAQIGRALESRNKEKGSNCRLKIYTFEKDTQILSVFDNISAVEISPAVTGESFHEIFSKAQLLLHTEAFDEASIDFVKNSISTKIADSLASGIPLLAYGPESVASMRHLKRNACALTAFSPTELQEMLNRAFTDTDTLHTVAKNGLQTAKKHHDPHDVAKRFREAVASVF